MDVYNCQVFENIAACGIGNPSSVLLVKELVTTFSKFYDFVWEILIFAVDRKEPLKL